MYVEGENLDLSGGQLSALYNDGTSEIIDLTESMITGFDNQKIGEQRLTVTYQGQKCDFSVNVEEKSLESISLEKYPEKVKYLEGKENLDMKGSRLRLKYNNGVTEIIECKEDMVRGFDNSKPGTQILTINYSGKTTTFDIEIMEKCVERIIVKKLPDKIIYIQGDAFDPTGMEVIAYYNNGTQEIIQDYEVTGFDQSVGRKNIVIQYNGLEADGFVVTVEPAGVTVSGIATSWNGIDDAKYLLYNASISDDEIRKDVKLDNTDNPDKALDYTVNKSSVTEGNDNKQFQQEFSFTGVPAGEYKLVIYKPGGYAIVIEKINVGSDNISKEIVNYLLGDINNDGKIRVNDKAILTRYLSKWTGYETLPNGPLPADINGDGKIKVNDKAILARYLAKWQGYESL